MGLPRRAGDPAELRKVGAGDWGLRAERSGRALVCDTLNRAGLRTRPQSLKPLLEKRRRARINESLRQLKGLILPLLGREVSAGALGGRG